MDNTGLVAINYLQNKKFVIPSYQRGYRWTSFEIEQFLVDLNDFFMSNKQVDDYYCLQPIVIDKKNNNEYSVIDGQQRITTIFLLLKYLFNELYFSISYETREYSEEFLNNIEDKTHEESKSNIDFFHMYNAFQCIKNWFYEHDTQLTTFKENIFNLVKVIWYEIPNNECELDVFERLNIGKIQLTEAEKIKALFLSQKVCGDKDRVKENAKIWYNAEIDARKDHDKLYCLFQNIDKKDIKIDNHELGVLNDDIQRVFVYLSSIAETEKDLFEYYYKRYKLGNLKSDWKNFIDCSIMYKKIVENNNKEELIFLYHLIGFMINQSINKYTARNIWMDFYNKKNNIQSMFNHLKAMIITEISKYIDELESLSFLDRKEKRKIYEALLLYNILLYQKDKSSAQSFPFNRFKLDQYTLEHIHAQKASILNNKQYNANIYDWLIDIYNFYKEESIYKGDSSESNKQEILNKITNAIDIENRKVILNSQELEELIEYLDQDFNLMEDMHFIENITLLDKSNNSRVGNLPYRCKKEIIQDKYNDPNFIPKSTKEVFSKDTTYWTAKYRKEYVDKLVKTLREFLGDN
ncbi:MAG: DUF262 domain-containing protein [Mucispirillum sp.]|nr:DUF262 domain-containing protein [Mucispirillum sp.]